MVLEWLSCVVYTFLPRGTLMCVKSVRKYLTDETLFGAFSWPSKSLELKPMKSNIYLSLNWEADVLVNLLRLSEYCMIG